MNSWRKMGLSRLTLNSMNVSGIIAISASVKVGLERMLKSRIGSGKLNSRRTSRTIEMADPAVA
jgi:hypothetical protein